MPVWSFTNSASPERAMKLITYASGDNAPQIGAVLDNRVISSHPWPRKKARFPDVQTRRA